MRFTKLKKQKFHKGFSIYEVIHDNSSVSYQVYRSDFCYGDFKSLKEAYLFMN